MPSLPSLEVQLLPGLVDENVLWRSILGAIDQDMDRLINVQSDFGKCRQNTDTVDRPKSLFMIFGLRHIKVHKHGHWR